MATTNDDDDDTPMSPERVRAAREELCRRGVLVDSGERRRNPETGEMEIAWMLNPNLTEEERVALVEMTEH